jgi:hypothetical protein
MHMKQPYVYLCSRRVFCDIIKFDDMSIGNFRFELRHSKIEPSIHFSTSTRSNGFDCATLEFILKKKIIFNVVDVILAMDRTTYLEIAIKYINMYVHITYIYVHNYSRFSEPNN